jgi:hypothetical protein
MITILRLVQITISFEIGPSGIAVTSGTAFRTRFGSDIM